MSVEHNNFLFNFSSVLIKAEGGTKKGAEKKGMQICMDQSIQSSFKEACYVHYSGLKPEY